MVPAGRRNIPRIYREWWSLGHLGFNEVSGPLHARPLLRLFALANEFLIVQARRGEDRAALFQWQNVPRIVLDLIGEFVIQRDRVGGIYEERRLGYPLEKHVERKRTPLNPRH